MLTPEPAATHLVRYLGAPLGQRIASAKANRAQVETPRDERPWPMFYRPVLTAAREYIDAGCSGPAFAQCLALADKQHFPAFKAVTEGLVAMFDDLNLVRSAGGKRLRIMSPEGPLARITFPLRAGTTHGGEVWFYLHYSSKRLTPDQLQLLSDLLACAPQPLLLSPTVIVGFPRAGTYRIVDRNPIEVQRAQRRLKATLAQYEADWAA